MKPWKAVSLILLALAVATAGYGFILVRRGFSALATPSAIEEFAATTARKIAVPSASRQLRNPIMPSTENIRGGMEHFSYHCAPCHSNDGGGHTVPCPAQLLQRRDPLIAVNDHVPVRLSGGHHHDARLLAGLGQRRQQPPLPRRMPDSKVLPVPVELVKLHFHQQAECKRRSDDGSICRD